MAKNDDEPFEIIDKAYQRINDGDANFVSHGEVCNRMQSKKVRMLAERGFSITKGGVVKCMSDGLSKCTIDQFGRVFWDLGGDEQ